MIFEEICSYCENEIDHITEAGDDGRIYCQKCSEEVEYHTSGEHDDYPSDDCPTCNE